MSRMYAQGFNSQASKDYHDFQSKQAGLSLKKMLEEPDKFEELVLAYDSSFFAIYNCEANLDHSQIQQRNNFESDIRIRLRLGK